MESEYIRALLVEQAALRAVVVALLKDRRQAVVGDKQALERERHHWMGLAWPTVERGPFDSGIEEADVAAACEVLIREALG